MKSRAHNHLPLGPLALILSKHYYGALSKSLEHLEIDRYFSVLHYLDAVGACSQQQICNALAIDKTAMVKVMEYLLQAGYVVRKTNPDDRREHFVSLTPTGKKRTAEVVTAFEALDAAAFRGVSAKDRRFFYRTASALLANLRAQPANDLFFNYKKTKRPGKDAAKK